MAKNHFYLQIAILIAVLILALGSVGWSATFTVNLTTLQSDAELDDGKCDCDLNTLGDQCSLMAAIEQANFSSDEDTILFDAGISSLSISAALPVITTKVTIDGGSSRVELQGGTGNCLEITSGECTLRGLVINGFLRGIYIHGGGNNRIENCLIGTDITGMTARANSDGIFILNSAGNTIGGPGDAKNVISGNNGHGILIEGSLATGNKVENNFIGTDNFGNSPIGNNYGVSLRAPDNTIGGSTEASRNIISSSHFVGILIEGSSASGNFIQNNFIGTDSGGSAALPNNYGIRIEAPDNTIGGSDSFRNIISGNYSNGLMIFNYNGNRVTGNYIGTDNTGQNALPNGTCGVSIVNGYENTIGGPSPALRNIISGNNICGVDIREGGSADNKVLGNYIGTDLAGTVALPNGYYGVNIEYASSNEIGGSTSGEGNLISGNGGFGIRIFAYGELPADNNKVLGNLIGVDKSGKNPIPNQQDGIYIYLGKQNQIGGNVVNSGNVISANQGNGISIGYAKGNIIQGNRIGTDNVTGDGIIGNQLEGIYLNGTEDTVVGGKTQASQNIISNNIQSGIFLSNAIGTKIQGNFIGTDSTGALNRGNHQFGIDCMSGTTVFIGGENLGEGNLITSIQGGIQMQQDDSSQIEGNRIGTDVSGTKALGNPGIGISISQSSGTRIGGTNHAPWVCDGACNLISGCPDGNGVYIESSDTCLVQGNFIGTDINGQSAIPNAIGVFLSFDIRDNVIGGTVNGAGNLISGNRYTGTLTVPEAGSGVIVDGSTEGTNKVQGNLIGTDASGILALPNSGSGIYLNKTDSVQVGGNIEEARNVISGNNVHGITIFEGHSHIIEGNYIGIDANGLSGLKNLGNGIDVKDSEGNIIGGETSASKNVISGNEGHGIEIHGTTSNENKIRWNFIGTDATALSSVPNNSNGILIRNAPANVIGGSPLVGNVISGNLQNGIEIEEAGSAGNKVQGNLIGTNTSGLSAIANEKNGIQVVNAPNTIIGGTTTEGVTGGNLISGNRFDGVEITGTEAAGSLITRNVIGVDSNGTTALGNGRNGISLDNVPNTIVGGMATSKNMISGNDEHGIHVSGGEATENTIQGNMIGTNFDGTLDLGNGSNGIFISSFVSETIIGGAETGSANTIAFNNGTGIAIESGTENAILVNSINMNHGLGIDLGSDGVTPNDAAPDSDAGPNNLQNYPILDGATGFITGELQSVPNTPYDIIFFRNDLCDASGNGEGKTHLESITVTTDSEGNAPFTTTITGQFITATAVDPEGNTSEFSPCISTGQVQTDFGDAPNPYPTLTGSNGAYHVIGNDLYLGTTVDNELDGQPNNEATGDDTNGADDEDGVLFTTPIVPGTIANVSVTASGTGFLNAWIDFNGDGDWEDAGEQIFFNQSLFVAVNALSFTVPEDSVIVPTFARFRFSSQPNLSPIGGAPDGEVEDHRTTITDPDMDEDGLPDRLEDGVCTFHDDPDSDEDGLKDGEEDANRNGVLDPGETSPCDWDSDGDGMDDGWEVNHALNPLADDADVDSDNDGFSNLREYYAMTNPRSQEEIPPIVSDADEDDDIDGKDLAGFSGELGSEDCSTIPCAYDLDGDGDVDDTDLLFFTEDFGVMQ